MFSVTKLFYLQLKDFADTTQDLSPEVKETLRVGLERAIKNLEITKDLEDELISYFKLNGANTIAVSMGLLVSTIALFILRF